MKKWIARWFGSAADAAPAAHAAAAPASAPAPLPYRAADVDVLFCQWLLGEPDAGPIVGAEKLILDELARIGASNSGGANLVPRVPAVIPQLLRSLRDEHISGAELARQITQDIVLVAEVIREVNTPYYHPAVPIKTIESAVMLLGQNGLRMLLARVAFRPVINMQSGHFARLAAPHVWSQSELCAQAANLLAGSMRANPFEAYLAGLIQNVGLIVAFRAIDQIWQGAALPQSDAFCAGLTATARVLSARIATVWEFPATVVTAIECMGDSARAAPLPLARALLLADRVSKLRLLVDADQLLVDEPFVADALDPSARAVFDKLRRDDS